MSMKSDVRSTALEISTRVMDYFINLTLNRWERFCAIKQQQSVDKIVKMHKNLYPD